MAPGAGPENGTAPEALVEATKILTGLPMGSYFPMKTIRSPFASIATATTLDDE